MYNSAQIKTRNSVERLFGVWKRRFACLKRTIQTKLETTPTIICALAVLHNIAIAQNEDIPQEICEHVDNNINLNNNPVADGQGLAFRRNFIINHF